MPDKIELQRTGFFREMPHGDPGDPALAEARDATPAPHEDRIAAYLEAGHVYIATPGVTHDVFDPGKQIGPPHYLTDGRFVWPGDLAHYVRTYHVRLSAALLEHMLASQWTVPGEIDLAGLALPERPSAPAGAGARPDPSSGPDLAAALAQFVRSLASTAGIDTTSLQQSIAAAGDDLARSVEQIGRDLGRSLEAIGPRIATEVASSLRTLRTLLDQPDEQRAAQVQAAMSSLEDQHDAALAPQRRAEDAERRERLSRDIRGTIAARLREHGLDPGDPGEGNGES